MNCAEVLALVAKKDDELNSRIQSWLQALEKDEKSVYDATVQYLANENDGNPFLLHVNTKKDLASNSLSNPSFLYKGYLQKKSLYYRGRIYVQQYKVEQADKQKRDTLEAEIRNNITSFRNKVTSMVDELVQLEKESGIIWNKYKVLIDEINAKLDSISERSSIGIPYSKLYLYGETSFFRYFGLWFNFCWVGGILNSIIWVIIIVFFSKSNWDLFLPASILTFIIINYVIIQTMIEHSKSVEECKKMEQKVEELEKEKKAKWNECSERMNQAEKRLEEYLIDCGKANRKNHNSSLYEDILLELNAVLIKNEVYVFKVYGPRRLIDWFNRGY
jgi:hypothetical protein